MSLLKYIPRLQVDGLKKAFPDDNSLWTIHLLTSEGLPPIATAASMASAQSVVLPPASSSGFENYYVHIPV